MRIQRAAYQAKGEFNVSSLSLSLVWARPCLLIDSSLLFLFFPRPFIAAFASTNLGDVSPNTNGAKCIDTGHNLTRI